MSDFTEWLIEQGTIEPIYFVPNKVSGFFIKSWPADENDPGRLIAWAPPDESFESAYQRRMNGEDPQKEMVKFVTNRPHPTAPERSEG